MDADSSLVFGMMALVRVNSATLEMARYMLPRRVQYRTTVPVASWPTGRWQGRSGTYGTNTASLGAGSHRVPWMCARAVNHGTRLPTRISVTTARSSPRFRSRSCLCIAGAKSSERGWYLSEGGTEAH